MRGGLVRKILQSQAASRSTSACRAHQRARTRVSGEQSWADTSDIISRQIGLAESGDDATTASRRARTTDRSGWNAGRRAVVEPCEALESVIAAEGDRPILPPRARLLRLLAPSEQCAGLWLGGRTLLLFVRAPGRSCAPEPPSWPARPFGRAKMRPCLYRHFCRLISRSFAIPASESFESFVI